MGASLAFEAALARYSRQNYILLNYHVHIPQPDPMTNPSTLERQKFYGVRSTPSHFIDGDSGGGGGGEDMARSIFEGRVEPAIEKHLTAAPEAAITLRATPSGSAVKVKVTVSRVKSTSDKLRLQIALAEDAVRYSGENGLRFHEMVVRSLAAVSQAPAAKAAVPARPAPSPAIGEKPASAPAAADKPAGAAVPAEAEKPSAAPSPAAGDKPAGQPPSSPALPTGFALKPGRGGSFEYTFDLAKVAADAKAHLDDYETNTAKGASTFRQKKHEIDAGKLSVVAFVQDEATKKILQAVYVKVQGGKPGK